MRRYGIIAAAAAALALGVPLAAADTPAPALVSSTPASPANDNAPIVSGTAASLALVTIYAGSGCAGGVAASGPADLAGNFALPVTVSDDSVTTFSANATDGVSTSACSNDLTYVEDSTPPPAPAITSHPATITNETTPSFSFSGEDGATFQCRLGSDPFVGCGSPQGYNLGQGAYTFEVRAIDAAGNVGPSSQFTWTIDTTPPPAPAITGAPNAASNDTTPAFSFEDGEPGVAFTCRLSAGAFSACTSPKTYTLGDGTYTFFVKATDAAGNESPLTSRTWTIDATAPATPVIQNHPGDPDGHSSTTFTFSDSEPVTFHCQVVGNPVVTCGTGSSTASYTTPSLSDGAHTFRVYATDAVGNTSPTGEFSWMIDTVSPLVTVNGPPQQTNQKTASFTFSANKPGSTYECQLDGAGLAACTSPQQYSGLADGAHTFVVRATSLGNAGPSVTYNWTVDATPPQTTIGSGPPSASTSAAATFAFSSSEGESTFTCRLDGGGPTPCTSPQSYSGLGNGQHTFSVESTDRAGNADTSPASYAWTISGVGPPTQDLRPPANVRDVRRNLGYGRLQLHWRNPSDRDFDHVAVFVATKRSAPPRTLVYTGRSQAYTDKRFKNGQYYRYLIVSYDHAKNAAGGTRVTIPSSSLLKNPGDGSVVHLPPLLRWTPVRGATFYNVQLYYHGAKVLSTWPAKARDQVARRWTYGKRFSLKKGLYVWYVWPGFGPRAKSRYGQLLGEGTFKVR